MSNQLFDGKEQIFKDTIQLAQTWKNAIDQSGFVGGSAGETLEFQKTPAAQKINRAKQALREYLGTLSFDDLKTIQVVMYLGRDRDYDKSQTPSEIYADYLNSFNLRGWETKEREINQMVQKAPLVTYLKDGLEILKVSV